MVWMLNGADAEWVLCRACRARAPACPRCGLASRPGRRWLNESCVDAEWVGHRCVEWLRV